MPISKKNTNKNSERKITIGEILDTENNETDICRQIFKFLTPQIKQLLTDFNEIENQHYELNNWEDFNKLFSTSDKKEDSVTSFRIRDLANWLVENHRPFIDQFEGSKITKANRAHTKTTYITNKVNKLVELGLLVIKRNKVESKRNKNLKTDICDITSKGVLIALTLDLPNYHKNSDEYKKTLKYLLEEWLGFIPAGYKDIHNYNYHFIVEIFNNCIENYDDILLHFFSLAQKHHNIVAINFSELRYMTNIEFYKKIIDDNEFREFFYNILYNFNLIRHLKVHSNPEYDEVFVPQKQQLIKFQFKLDVENFIERNLSAALKTKTFDVKLSQWAKRIENKPATMGEVFQHNNYMNIDKEIVLDFEIKNKWEQERNHNLLDLDRIALMIKCDNCNQIYPYPFEIEKESFNEIICRYCNGYNIKYYDFKK